MLLSKIKTIEKHDFFIIFHWVTLNEELYIEDAWGKYSEKSFRNGTVHQILLVRYDGLGIRIHGRDEKCMQNPTWKT